MLRNVMFPARFCAGPSGGQDSVQQRSHHGGLCGSGRVASKRRHRPSDLVATGQIPDIVLLDRVKKTIVLLELTCPFDSSQDSFKAALDRKTILYCRLALDCQSLGYTSYSIPFEVGARGVITARNHTVLAMVASMCGIRNVKTLRRTLGKIALVASYRIYLARTDWSSGKLVSP